MADEREDETTIRTYSLNEIFDIAKRQETEPWPAKEALAAGEEDYRRGYLDGWDAAVEAIYRLMHERDFTIGAAADAADAHKGKALRQWRMAKRAKVLGHPLFTSACNEPQDWPPSFPWKTVRKPSITGDGGE